MVSLSMIDMVKLVTMMLTLVALYVTPYVIPTNPERHWCWIVVLVLLMMWSFVSLLVIFRKRKAVCTQANKNANGCLSGLSNIYHVLLLCMHLTALIVILTNGLGSSTSDFTGIYTLVALVFPVCVYMVVEVYSGQHVLKPPTTSMPEEERTQDRNRLTNRVNLRLATQLWIPGKNDIDDTQAHKPMFQGGSTVALNLASRKQRTRLNRPQRL